MGIIKDCKMRHIIMGTLCIIMFFIITAVLMWVWNRIIPWVIGFPPVTYWQAAGLIIVFRILIGRLGIAKWCRHISKCSCGCGTKRDE